MTLILGSWAILVVGAGALTVGVWAVIRHYRRELRACRAARIADQAAYSVQMVRLKTALANATERAAVWEAQAFKPLPKRTPLYLDGVPTTEAEWAVLNGIAAASEEPTC